jgi:hypothetical protein
MVYVLTLILINIAGEPAQIHELKPTFAECNTALATVASALANTNRVVAASCNIMQRSEDKPASPDKPA